MSREEHTWSLSHESKIHMWEGIVVWEVVLHTIPETKSTGVELEEA